MEHAVIPLSDRGHLQAGLVAQHLPGAPSRILVSPMIRTQQTAQPYCIRYALQPEILPALAEFSVICSTLIEGLAGGQRKPFVDAFWADSDPHRRMGPGADTFLEFNERVVTFMDGAQRLPDSTVIFGHGIWFGLLMWRLQGNRRSMPMTCSAFGAFSSHCRCPTARCST